MMDFRLNGVSPSGITHIFFCKEQDVPHYQNLFNTFFLHQYPQITQKHIRGSILARLWGKIISPRLNELKFGVHFSISESVSRG